MDQIQLQEILEKHKKWWFDEEGGERADLRGAYLRGAYLQEADLRGAYLQGAYLQEADLRGADLRGAYLRGADLRGAYLRGADLQEADLRGAYLRGADLQEADLPLIPYACPDFGMFIGYKKSGEGLIVELEIPADAKRLSATGRKCRCDKAKVLRILNTDRTVSDKTETFSQYRREFIYKVGETVSVDDFDEDRWNECSTGIHFFINFQEAVEY